MAISAFNQIVRSRPFNRISRLRTIFKPTREQLLQQFIRKKLLPPSSLRWSSPRLGPVIHDTRIRGSRKDGDDSTSETGAKDMAVQNPDAGVFRFLGSHGFQPSNFDNFMTINLADYIPIKIPNARPSRKILVDWHHATDPDNNPILRGQEYVILKKLATALSSGTNNRGKFTKELVRWLKDVQAHPATIQYLTPFAWEAFFAYERGAMPTILTIHTAEIMEAVGLKRDEKQECDYIGALFWNRNRTEAVQRWVHLVQSLNKPSIQTWNLGIKLFSLRKEPEKAKSVYDMMNKSLGYSDPKSLVPIILAWNHLYKHSKAWFLYQKLRQFVNRDTNCVKPGHLEDIALSFMDAGNPGAAFAVWKYMWKKGMAVPGYTKEAAIFYQNIIRRPEVLHHFSSTLLGVLKERVSDKYFYASWINNLIRLGRPDLTLKVKEVMESNGLRPDSQHVNRIIYGFFKDGYEDIATSLGDELIRERLKKVQDWELAIAQKKLRKEAQPFGISLDSLPSELRGDSQSPMEVIEKGLNTPPMASAQTFSILLHYYTRRGRHDKVLHYIELMMQCKTPITSRHLNHLLNMHLRRSDMLHFEGTFDIMVHQLGCKPDQETWKLMWYAMWKRFTQPKRRIPTHRTPRNLFIEMVKAIPVFKYRDPLSAWGKQPGSRDIWRVMIRSFLLARDWDGLIVALNAGDALWMMTANEGVFKEVSFGLLKKGRPGLIQLQSGRITRGHVTRRMIGHAVRELITMQTKISLLTRLARISARDHSRIRNAWKKIISGVRKIPVEEAAAALDAVTKVLKDEAGDMHSKVGVERLMRVRDEMGLKHVGIKNTLAPVTEQMVDALERPWMSNLYKSTISRKSQAMR